jgi:hypothetical protein
MLGFSQFELNRKEIKLQNWGWWKGESRWVSWGEMSIDK